MSAKLEGNGHSWTNGRCAGASIAAALLATLAFAGSAGAATYTPNSTSDGAENGADCPPDAAAAPGACSLRDAVAAANDSDANDEIVLEGQTYDLDPSLGTISIDPENRGGTLVIRGTSARATIIDGNSTEEGGTRPVTFFGGSKGELRDLALTGGNGTGCSFYCAFDGPTYREGGGLAVQDSYGEAPADADALLTRVRVFGNHAQYNGGGITTDGKLTLVDSLVDGNVAGIDGGGIENGDQLTVVNSTITGNKALGQVEETGAAGQADNGNGGGIDNAGDADFENRSTYLLKGEAIPPDQPYVRADNSTIAGNAAAGNGGGVFTYLGSTTAEESRLVGTPKSIARFHNTIVSDNTADGDANCSGNQPQGSGTFTSSEGYNLEDGDSCLFTAGGDLNDKAGLGALADNGGPTDTLALAADSRALNAAEADGCPAADQRGIARPQDSKCDIGAYERVAQQAPQDQDLPPQQTPAARTPRCLDTLPPITTLNREGLRVTEDGVTLKGRSRDQAPPCISGVQRVEVSMAKVSGTDLNCRFLRRSTEFLLSPFQNCRQPIRFVAQGTNSWTFRFKLKLKPGRYRAQARGYDEERNKETPKKHRNIVVFRVK